MRLGKNPRKCTGPEREINEDLGNSRPLLQRVKENRKEAALSRNKNRKALYHQSKVFFSLTLVGFLASCLLQASMYLSACQRTITDEFCPPSQERKRLVSQPAPGVCHFVIIHPATHVKFVQNYIHQKTHQVSLSCSQD